jgi:hypothetical protein
MSPAADKVLRRLDGARQQWWLFTLLTTAVLAVWASLGTMFLFMLADSLLQFSQAMLAAMLAVWAVLTIGLTVLVCRRLLGSQRSLEATARCVETEFPELGSELINIVQLCEDTKNADRAFCEAAVSQSAVRLGNVRFEGAAAKESRWRRFLYCMQTPRDLVESLLGLVILVGIAMGVNWLNPNFGSAASRLMSPGKFVPSVGTVKIIEVQPQDTDVLAGESLEITALIVDESEDEPYRGTLFRFPEGKDKEVLSMLPGDRYTVDVIADGQKVQQPRRLYSLTLPSVNEEMEYRLQVGDTQTPLYRVGISQKPIIDAVEVTLDYPEYLGRESETSTQDTADMEAPQYTVAELRIYPSAPIARGHIDAEGQQFSGRIENNGQSMLVSMPLVKNTTFTVHMSNASGYGDPNPRLNRVRILPDRKPKVELVAPARQTTAAPGSDVAVKIRASDDHGVSYLRLEAKVKRGEKDAVGQMSADGDQDRPVIKVKEWTRSGIISALSVDHTLKLTEELAKPGQTVLVRAVARDSRDFSGWGLDLKPQEALSGWHTIRIVDEEVRNEAVLQQLDDLRTAIFKILQKQIRAQARNALIRHANEMAECTARVGDVRGLQIDVQKSSIGLAKAIGLSQRQEHKVVKRSLNKLAFGEMLIAVQQCDGMLKIDMPDGFGEPVTQLHATQGRIVEALRELLDVSRRARSKELAEMGHRAEGDLPDDARQKLDDINKALEEALEMQKKVVEASENLAKAPVEDFSEAKEQLLAAMAAAEDAWGKFMTELNTDLSKLPEQDFANASCLKELVEIQTEIKMAKDSLLKKTADIAVPLEQLGAEMAEEIQTNMEKWLPDTPDRDRWSQEESLTDESKEAPMAELPGELEDLIGELMEEEEDLFDEMEDVSSSAADSLDKGAGWDVMDGPISNMSAKGATGNRLPNTSEIGGRAGEGRQGKSSGEFVGDAAVGKGGRNTPTRLTPDAYVKGQIKDHSKDPTGGATGGGKESGEGGEGLEGPAPGFRGQRDTNRLAGKQAELRNKAEGIDLKHFRIMGYHHTDLGKMIELMSQVERDLAAGRYRNALRQRTVMIEGLGDVKQHLEGEFEIRQDVTSNLPSDVQEKLIGSMDDPSPAGWEELNREYFKRLSAGDGSPARE